MSLKQSFLTVDLFGLGFFVTGVACASWDVLQRLWPLPDDNSSPSPVVTTKTSPDIATHPVGGQNCPPLLLTGDECCEDVPPACTGMQGVQAIPVRQPIWQWQWAVFQMGTSQNHFSVDFPEQFSPLLEAWAVSAPSLLELPPVNRKQSILTRKHQQTPPGGLDPGLDPGPGGGGVSVRSIICLRKLRKS